MSDDLRYVRKIADYQFGVGVGRLLFPDGSTIELSKGTGRPRRVYLDGVLLATVRPDGLLALTIHGAERLLKAVGGRRFRVYADERAVELVLDGRDLMCGYVADADEDLLPGDEALVVDRSGRLLAVGRAAVSGRTMKSLSEGVAVRIRGTKTKSEEMPSKDGGERG